jgi:hypothetical protein
MANARNLSTMAQGASTAGILSGTYGGTGANLTPTTAGNVIFTADGSVWSSTQKIVRGTSVSASGTSVDFTGIPSWVKRITIMLNGISTTSTGAVLFQIGTGGSPTTSGYTSVITTAFGTNSVNTSTSTAGFLLGGSLAAYTYNGNIFITNLSGNIWCCSGLFCNTVTTPYTGQMAGSVTLAGVLNLVRMTTTAGTDTFDAGSVNILYE